MPRFCAMMLAGGFTTVAWTRPVRVASTRAVVLPICTMVTSLPGVSPIFDRGVARDEVRRGAETADRHCAAFELLSRLDLGARQQVVIERGDAADDEGRIRAGEHGIHHSRSGQLSDGRVGGNQRHHRGRAAGEKNQLYVEPVLFKDPRVFGDPGRQGVAADGAVADVELDELRLGRRGGEKEPQASERRELHFTIGHERPFLAIGMMEATRVRSLHTKALDCVEPGRHCQDTGGARLLYRPGLATK